MCAQNIQTNDASTCQQVAIEYSLPVAALRNLNVNEYCQNLDNATLCAPPACPIAVNSGDTMSLTPFLTPYTNFTKTQFLTWNPFIDTAVIAAGDAVCVG